MKDYGFVQAIVGERRRERRPLSGVLRPSPIIGHSRKAA
jgi:hypothetical protein